MKNQFCTNGENTELPKLKKNTSNTKKKTSDVRIKPSNKKTTTKTKTQSKVEKPEVKPKDIRIKPSNKRTTTKTKKSTSVVKPEEKKEEPKDVRIKPSNKRVVSSKKTSNAKPKPVKEQKSNLEDELDKEFAKIDEFKPLDTKEAWDDTLVHKTLVEDTKNKDSLEKNTIVEIDKPININKETKKKRLVLRKQFIIMFLVIFSLLIINSGYNIIRWLIDARNTKEQVKEIQKIVEVNEVIDSDNIKIVNPPSNDLPNENPYWDYIKMNLINVDFSNLKNKNSDTVAWLQVNGTNINYPVVQSKNNTYYLKKDFNKKYNQAGWVFMDYRNNLQSFDQNTIIYAHGRVDGTMFGSLKNILESNWYNDANNYVVKLSTEYENTLWQVFSVYRIEATSDYLETNFSSDESYNKFLNMLYNRSEFRFDVTLNELDKILTLSTCYKQNDRVVLHAKLIKMEVKDGSNR